MAPAGERRPLTARSVIASTLLGVDPPRLPALALVRSGELFGLREGATRTALSRMASAGEVVADDGGYALTGPLLERHARQQSARAGTTSVEWDGTWTAAVITAERRAAGDRAAFRTSARRAKLAEVRDGVWMRPSPVTVHPDDRAVIDAQATWLRHIDADEPDRLVRAFSLDDWARTAESLLDEIRTWQRALDERRTDSLGETFVVSAAVLRHLVADPALPDALMPDDWPGERLRHAYDAFDRAFKATWRAWHRAFSEG